MFYSSLAYIFHIPFINAMISTFYKIEVFAMTIRHLKIFILVATCGKMRQAAEALYISQPAVSQAIKELEAYYNVKLFERLTQKLYLTEEGTQLLHHARYVVDSFDNLDLMMKKQGISPKLRIGGSVSVGTFLLNDVIDQMERTVKDLEFKVVVHNTSTIEELIKNGQLDVAIVEGTLVCDELIELPIYKDELVIIVGKGHPLYHKERVTLEELKDAVWIGREEGSMNRNQYEQLLADKNYIIKHKWICTNTETIKQTVSRGRGLAILSKMLIQKEISEGILRILTLDDLHVTRDIKLIYHKDKFISPLLQTFIEICQHLYKSI